MKKSLEDGQTQKERFLRTARELACDEDKDRFEAKLAAIARQKLPPESGGAPASKKAKRKRD